MIDFTGFLVTLGLIATVFVGGIMIGYFVALRQFQEPKETQVMNLPAPKKKPKVKMWGYSKTEATIWCDNPEDFARAIRGLPGVSKVECYDEDGNDLYVEFDPRFDLIETIRKIEALG